MKAGTVFFLLSIIFTIILEFTGNDLFLPSIFFLLSQFFTGLIIVLNKEGRFDFTDMRLIYLCTLFLYSIFTPAVTLAGFLSLSREVIPATYLYGTSFMGLNVANLFYYKRKTLTSDLSVSAARPNKFSVIFHLVLIITFFAVAKNLGLFGFSFTDLKRGEIFKFVNQIWIVLIMLINASCFYNIYYFLKLKKVNKILFVCSTLIYIVFHLQLGNRRDYLPIILAAFLMYSVYKGLRLNYKSVILITFLFLGSFWITSQRDESVRSLNDGEKMELAIYSNEFVYPFQTLYYIIKDDWPHRFGYTYFIMPFEILIPRALYPEKPKGLGEEFVEKTFGGNYMGFAFTPTTEAFLNFGYVGPFLMFFIFGSFINHLIKRSNTKGKWLAYLVFYSLSFEIFRGDFPSLFYQLIIIFFFLWILEASKLKNK